MKYLKLFACCITVKGARRSIIADLQRKHYAFIPNTLTEILSEYKTMPVDDIKRSFNNEHDADIDEYFNYLVNNEYAFYTDEPQNFPDIDMSWQVPYIISNSILDIGEELRYDIANVVAQLDALNCEALQFRIFSLRELAFYEDLLKLTAKTSISSIQIILPYGKDVSLLSLRRLLKTYPRAYSFIIYGHREEGAIDMEHSHIIYTQQKITDCSYCGIINEAYFAINIAAFTESLHKNSCLNRKVSIDEFGEVKNCPSLRKSYGHADSVRLEEIIADPMFTALWDIKKDQVLVCKDCEFRYICTDCRAYTQDEDNIFSKPSKCRYNPYTATWIEA